MELMLAGGTPSRKGTPNKKNTLKPNLRMEWIDLYPCCIHKCDMLRCVEVYMLKYVEVIYAQNAHYYIDIYYMNIIFHMLHGGRQFRRDL